MQKGMTRAAHRRWKGPGEWWQPCSWAASAWRRGPMRAPCRADPPPWSAERPDVGHARARVAGTAVLTSLLVLSFCAAGCSGLVLAFKTGLNSPSLAPRSLHEPRALSSMVRTPRMPHFQSLQLGSTATDCRRLKSASQGETAEAPLCPDPLVRRVQWVLLEPRHTQAFIAYTRAQLGQFPGQPPEPPLSVCCSPATVSAEAFQSSSRKGMQMTVN